eukprot:366040-Chlamydomonas_euryale.AAC.2
MPSPDECSGAPALTPFLPTPPLPATQVDGHRLHAVARPALPRLLFHHARGAPRHCRFALGLGGGHGLSRGTAAASLGFGASRWAAGRQREGEGREDARGQGGASRHVQLCVVAL